MSSSLLICLCNFHIFILFYFIVTGEWTILLELYCCIYYCSLCEITIQRYGSLKPHNRGVMYGLFYWRYRLYFFSSLYLFCDDNLNDNSFYFYTRYKIILYLLHYTISSRKCLNLQTAYIRRKFNYEQWLRTRSWGKQIFTGVLCCTFRRRLTSYFSLNCYYWAKTV